ncbi:hypothetical protein DLAC_05096 [Tieghemostelium lacteum]|uniref:CDK5 regulatory subunit-associated protein 1 n=1 Tax=Tieghemostelium lacteum TaxID=361077 RepID=A0A151ZII4_TIELA|nr:hypothetical protein DLAC_05096 [Tieghemostelium lacteum]|eukprot:KYQ93709.1 hypothetical protein DLAC_05096 [Tieghemostelium lacteum]
MILQRSVCRNLNKFRNLYSFRQYSTIASTNENTLKIENIKNKLKDAPNLSEFIKLEQQKNTKIDEKDNGEVYIPPPYLRNSEITGEGRRVYVESYGCQMNFADTEVINSIMKSSGYQITDSDSNADVIFLNTCAIRENAESKIWGRLSELRAQKRKLKNGQLLVGVLGCMAERLKQKLLESEMKVDLVVGPDAYRSLPSLLSAIEDGEQQTAINVMLSADETYADIAPVRTSQNSVSAYVSIMRGCNNMCSYCIVPFTRGKERSRPVQSILEEVKQLSEQGYKEITLLGQNVNSYNYLEEEHHVENTEKRLPRDGFNTIYKSPKKGVTFTQLIDQVSLVDPEMRIRFTSPHPKDFPDDLLHLIKERPNICKSLHIPAQSGNSNVLKNMRRGYTRESYIELINTIRRVLPEATISSDFISGFCHETEEEHLDTLSLLEYVKFDHAFMFYYSLREKTHAHRTMKDDVPLDVKSKRLQQVVDTFYRVLKQNTHKEIGKKHLVLIDRISKRSDKHYIGRTDTNKKVIIPNHFKDSAEPINVGDYVLVEIEDGSEITLKGNPIMKSSIEHFQQYQHKKVMINEN